MRKTLAIAILASMIWMYGEEGERKEGYERQSPTRIEIYDEDYNRTGHIRKQGNRWIEYDEDWNRVKTYEEDRIIEHDD